MLNLKYDEPRQRVKKIVLHYEGCSLAHRRDELASLVGRDFEDTPEADSDPDRGRQAVQLRTNCATFAFGVLALSCLSAERARAVHPILLEPTQIGTAFSRLVQFGRDTGSLVIFHKGKTAKPRMGDVLWYRSGGNDDHAEVLLSDIGDDWVAFHGGGGRANNAITTGNSAVDYSLGRPLYGYISIDALRLPPAEVAPPTEEEIAWMRSLREAQEWENVLTAKIHGGHGE